MCFHHFEYFCNFLLYIIVCFIFSFRRQTDKFFTGSVGSCWRCRIVQWRLALQRNEMFWKRRRCRLKVSLQIYIYIYDIYIYDIYIYIWYIYIYIWHIYIYIYIQIKTLSRTFHHVLVIVEISKSGFSRSKKPMMKSQRIALRPFQVRTLKTHLWFRVDRKTGHVNVTQLLISRDILQTARRDWQGSWDYYTHNNYGCIIY